MEVALPDKCANLRDLETRLAKALEVKKIVDSAPLLFDEEDVAVATKSLARARHDLEAQSKEMSMPNSLAVASSFAERVNARLPFLHLLRAQKDAEVTQFFEDKQRRLAFQAQEMLRISLSQNNVGAV
jgi:hypothetical protein